MTEDVLSDVLRTVRLSGAIFYEVRGGEPWAVQSPPGDWIAPRLLPGAQHLIAYHVVIRGRCWAGLVDGAAQVDGGAHGVELTPGSVALFPHGDAHVMSTAAGMRTEPSYELYRLPGPEESLPFHVDARDGTAESVRVLCGYLGCDAQPFNPLIQALPRLVHICGGDGATQGTLGSFVEAVVAESSTRRSGGAAVLSRLSELLFIETVRRYMASLPADDPGWLGAVADPCVGRALRLLHDDPARAWSLQTLSRAVGASRTVLVERFRRRLGCAPMTYLVDWRMQVAASLLADGADHVGDVASAVGYGSEEAFCRAFKRKTGRSPAEWRKRPGAGFKVQTGSQPAHALH